MDYQKRFDQELYDANDGPAKAIVKWFVKKWFNDDAIILPEIPTKPQPDLKGRYWYEAQRALGWIDSTRKPESILVYGRKSKILPYNGRENKPLYIFAISNDGKAIAQLPTGLINNKYKEMKTDMPTDTGIEYRWRIPGELCLCWYIGGPNEHIELI